MGNEQSRSAPGETSPLVSTAWLADAAPRPDLRILDCSVVMRTAPDGTYSFVAGRDEWNAAHIPGSIFLDVLGELADKTSSLPMMMPPAAVFAAAMEEHGVGEGTQPRVGNACLVDAQGVRFRLRGRARRRLQEVACRGQAHVP
jgi:3-mercaptopyruvate sulfurtransferase SseA